MKKTIAAVLALALLFVAGSAPASGDSSLVILEYTDARTPYWEWSISTDSLTLYSYKNSGTFSGHFEVAFKTDDDTLMHNNYAATVSPEIWEGVFFDNYYFFDHGFIPSETKVQTQLGTWEISGYPAVLSVTDMAFDDSSANAGFIAEASLLDKYSKVILPSDLNVEIPVTFICEYGPVSAG